MSDSDLRRPNLTIDAELVYRGLEALRTERCTLQSENGDCTRLDERIKQAEQAVARFAKDPLALIETEQQRMARHRHEFLEDSSESLTEELLTKYRSALLTSGQLEKKSMEPRAKLLGDWLCEGDLGFIYGERGIGKSWFVDAICAHLSIGKGLDTWRVETIVPVLYLDGEMPQDATRDRFKGLAAGNENLFILHHERLFDVTGLSINLADPVTQKAITGICVDKKIKVLAIDNLSCLVSGVKENDADAWELLLSWLLELRRRRIAVIIVHHAGRQGWMRGTTKREDSAAWVIKVESAKGEPCVDGARFETSFTKKPRNTTTLEWNRVWHFKTEENSEVSIGCEEVSNEGKVLQLIQDGLQTATDIAEEMSCAKSVVSKMAQRLETKKLIEIKNRRYFPRGFMNTK